MDEDRIRAKLDELSELYFQQDVLALEEAQRLDAAMPLEVREARADIRTGLEPRHSAIADAIASLVIDVKAAIIAGGASVKAEHLHAVYNKGRSRWDTKGLAGYAVAHPEVGAFHTVGKPSVSLRKR